MIIECQITGAAARADDVDQLAEMVANLNESISSMQASKAEAVRALVSLTESAGDTRQTRHLVGTGYDVKVTMPPQVEYDPGALRAAWADTSETWRGRLLKIRQVGVQAREWKKWREAASSDPDFLRAQKLIRDAERTSDRSPSVSVKVRS